MEIGISQDVLIDIGLNMAGFILGGMILLLLASFRKSRRMAVDVSSGTAAMVRPSAEPPLKDRVRNRPGDDFKGEYVNFKNFDWRNERAASNPKRESPSALRNRQEVIKMAKQMLAEKRGDRDVKTDLPVTDGELAYARYLEKLTSTGRNK